MEPSLLTTRFASLSRRQALLVLAALVLALAWCLSAARARPAAPATASTTHGGEDLQLYRRIVERVHAGEPYHDAAGDELRQRGYPTGSIFNWRPPTYAWVLGLLPGAAAVRGVLVLLSLTAILLVCDAEWRSGGLPRAALLALLLIGLFSWCIDGEAYFAQEVWAMMLLTLSLGCYARGWWLGGLLAGLAALFFRELMLPYVLIAAFLAGREGRWREVAMWAVGLTLYALLMAYHASEVTRRLTAADRIEADGWVQFGGLGFVLSTVQMNAWLFPLPREVAALYLVLALLGLAGWRGGTRAGMTAAAYLAAFAVVGKPMNNYWGLLAAPLLALGAAQAPAALRDLFRGVGGRQGQCYTGCSDLARPREMPCSS